MRPSHPPAALLGLAFTIPIAACATAARSAGAPLPAPIPEGRPLAGKAPAPLPAPPPPPTCSDRVGPGVRRAAVVRTVEAGLGFWLRGVSVEEKIVDGRFRGWIVKRLYPGDVCYADLDLREGDTVLHVNGRSVERPEQAHDVFVALRFAPAIVVDYERDGVARTMRVDILDR